MHVCMWIYFNEHELEQTPGDGKGQGNLACYNPRGHEESDVTWQLNNSIPVTEKKSLKFQVSLS